LSSPLAQGLVIQDPFNMGYLGVNTMIEHLWGTVVEKRIDTGATLVTLNNIQNEKSQNQLFPPLDEYLEY
jgi:ribose transport system substrate-binding protein